MIVPALLTYPIEDLLSKCSMRPGIPLKPMLAHPTKSLPEILDRFQDQKFTCEYKYDGERAQVSIIHTHTLHPFDFLILVDPSDGRWQDLYL